MHEAELSPAGSSFLTLTYDRDRLTQRSLDVRDWQLFAKNLRYHAGPFRYYAIGEYTDSWLPHFHACIFGQDFVEPIKAFAPRRHWCLSRGGFPLYRSDLLEACWPHGFSYIGALTRESAAYCSGYIIKKTLGKDAEEHYRFLDINTGELEDLKPEFAVMSRRPGLGRGWFDQFAEETYRDDFIVLDGKKRPVPKYYDRLFKEAHPAEYDAIAERRKRTAKTREHDETPERLEQRQAVAKAKQELKERRLERDRRATRLSPA